MLIVLSSGDYRSPPLRQGHPSAANSVRFNARVIDCPKDTWGALFRLQTAAKGSYTSVVLWGLLIPTHRLHEERAM